jgi:hypothetical protein
MRTTTPLRTLGLIAVAALLSAAACDDGNGTATEPATPQDLDETARVVGALMAAEQGGDLATVRDGVMTAQAKSSGGFSLDVSGVFVGQHLGLAYDVALECYDDDGGALTCGEGDTASADLMATWSGELNIGGLSVASALSGDWMLDGLDEAVATANGGASATLDVLLTHDGQRRSLRVAFAGSYDDVLVDTSTHHAIGGTVTYALDVERRTTTSQGERVASFSADAVVTLGADRTATLALSGSRYRVDLATGDVDPM